MYQGKATNLLIYTWNMTEMIYRLSKTSDVLTNSSSNAQRVLQVGQIYHHSYNSLCIRWKWLHPRQVHVLPFLINPNKHILTFPNQRDRKCLTSVSQWVFLQLWPKLCLHHRHTDVMHSQPVLHVPRPRSSECNRAVNHTGSAPLYTLITISPAAEQQHWQLLCPPH